ncbi:histidine kinase [Actinoallomurus iriomotensis]|uniref:Signal transduction histidine kinase n=1 Tax=Actinoallomurus iriomotensis TaxID=478107 RepID=A0A9W6VJ84_9ACTN|nr:histidine kinase [Actinoallomurus iriomotensis]GLY73778.1 signal transduction histidine kinase [Actinoallomurus iriomotensis]
MNGALLGVCGVLLLAVGVLVGRWSARPRRTAGAGAGALTEASTLAALHAASLAAPPLRAGLNESTAGKSARRIRDLLGTRAVCLTDRASVLTWDGIGGDHHRAEALAQAASMLQERRAAAVPTGCHKPGCPLGWAFVAPLTVEDEVLGTLIAYGPAESAGLVRAAEEVARWISVQLELAELDRSRTRLIEAEIRALRAQISPHFIYNSLAAIASFVRTDPDRARELLLEFADFTRYSFRRHGDFTTLAEELHSIEQYLTLAGARFGDRLEVTLQVAPEVLPVTLPFLCLQPLVENAVKHGLEDSAGTSHITITAQDAGVDAIVAIEDDGAGMDPRHLGRILDGEGGPSTGIGLRNVDQRLRQVYGDGYGLVAETGVEAGMKVTVRIPKYHKGVLPSPGPAR